MGDQNFLITYVQACASDKLPFSECQPVWQFGIIAGLLALSIVVLIVLRMRADPQSAPS